LLLFRLANHRVPLRDGSCRNAFFNTAFSIASCPQNRSNSATLASSAWVGVGSDGANAPLLWYHIPVANVLPNLLRDCALDILALGVSHRWLIGEQSAV
jgi:hypothetical protein